MSSWQFFCFFGEVFENMVSGLNGNAVVVGFKGQVFGYLEFLEEFWKPSLELLRGGFCKRSFELFFEQF